MIGQFQPAQRIQFEAEEFGPDAAAVLIVGGGTPALDFTAGATSASDLTTYTFSALSLGAADSDRTILAAVQWKSPIGVLRTLSSATIGGVAATIGVQIDAGNGDPGAAIIAADVPTGTTGDVVLVFSGQCSEAAVQVNRAIGLGSLTPYATGSNAAGTAGVYAVNVNTPTDGFLITSGCVEGGTAFTWVGPTEVYDAIVGGILVGAGLLYPTISLTPMTVTATDTGGVSNGAVVSASYSP